MRKARAAAMVRVWALRGEILLVADALRERRAMSQRQIDAVLRGDCLKRCRGR
jgi:hypothetical protein